MKINAVPVGLNESEVMIFLEKIFEILEYKTEEDFINHYEEQWVKIQYKSKYDFLYKLDVEELIKEFASLGFPEYTQEGKRCFVELPLEDLKNRF